MTMPKTWSPLDKMNSIVLSNGNKLDTPEWAKAYMEGANVGPFHTVGFTQTDISYFWVEYAPPGELTASNWIIPGTPPGGLTAASWIIPDAKSL